MKLQTNGSDPNFAAWIHGKQLTRNEPVVETIHREEVRSTMARLLSSRRRVIVVGNTCLQNRCCSRVVATQPCRLSAPILFCVDGVEQPWLDNFRRDPSIHPPVQECNGLTIEMIHNVMQPA